MILSFPSLRFYCISSKIETLLYHESISWKFFLLYVRHFFCSHCFKSKALSNLLQFQKDCEMGYPAHTPRGGAITSEFLCIQFATHSSNGGFIVWFFCCLVTIVFLVPHFLSIFRWSCLSRFAERWQWRISRIVKRRWISWITSRRRWRFPTYSSLRPRSWLLYIRSWINCICGGIVWYVEFQVEVVLVTKMALQWGVLAIGEAAVGEVSAVGVVTVAEGSFAFLKIFW